MINRYIDNDYPANKGRCFIENRIQEWLGAPAVSSEGIAEAGQTQGMCMGRGEDAIRAEARVAYRKALDLIPG